MAALAAIGTTPIDKPFDVLIYVLLISFFPQLVAGSIKRSKNLLSQVAHVEEISLWDYERDTRSLMLMLLWQPLFPSQEIFQSDGDFPGKRALARRKLELHRVGRASWILPDHRRYLKAVEGEIDQKI